MIGDLGTTDKQPSVYPTMLEDHLGPIDTNGIRPINDSGFKHIDTHIQSMPVPDNSYFNQPKQAADSSQNNQQSPQKEGSGLIGKTVGNDLMQGSGADAAIQGAGKSLGEEILALL